MQPSTTSLSIGSNLDQISIPFDKLPKKLRSKSISTKADLFEDNFISNQLQLIYQAYSQYLGNILDPHICPGCQHPLAHLQLFCIRCHLRLRLVVNPCQLCGLENHNLDKLCAACLYDPPRWQHMIAPLQYQGLSRKLLLQLKFSEALYLANTLVSTVVHRFSDTRQQPQALLPVPLHQQRLFERGFNQAYEIARILSSQLNIKLDHKILTRIRPTEAQAGLSSTQREKNILKAFRCENNHYRHVAIVDDIVTTGASANEITKTLHKSGIEIVEVWSLARVIRY